MVFWTEVEPVALGGGIEAGVVVDDGSVRGGAGVGVAAAACGRVRNASFHATGSATRSAAGISGSLSISWQRNSTYGNRG